MLRARLENTKGSGFYRDRLDAPARPRHGFVMADARSDNTQEARKAAQLLLTRLTVADFPNLWTGSAFDQLTRISDAKPQQTAYSWPDGGALSSG